MSDTFQAGDLPKPPVPKGYRPNYDKIPTNPSGRFTLKETETGFMFKDVYKQTLSEAIGQLITFAYRLDCSVNPEDLIKISTMVLDSRTQVSEYEEVLLGPVSVEYPIKELVKLGTDQLSIEVLQKSGVLLSNTPIEIEVIREQLLNDF